ncbi:hypothetical protein ACHFJ0_01605 [Paracoccus sp. NGMCC 1.201697]|uniref:PAS domain-containing protein n=1 Tax=Paracoccus broussonetiae subsp. drimophilus TaxID=3373869 RepID=A0ABW7LFL8_9RHOB
MLDPDQIAGLFTRDGRFLCARWGRPVVPVIFGLADETLDIFRAVTRAALAHAGLPMAETDPEMGANMLSFFVRDWQELADMPDLERLTGQGELVARLTTQAADQYRIFRFDADGGIRACMNFVNMGGGLAEAHPAGLAETMVMRSLLTFARDVEPSRQVADLIRAAYDPALPVVAHDESHALRLAARLPA